MTDHNEMKYKNFSPFGRFPRASTNCEEIKREQGTTGGM
jgi:hypothetical protein